MSGMSARFEQAFFLPRPVTVFVAGPFVMQFFALGETDLQFGFTVLPVKGKRNQCESFALHGTDEMV